MPVPVRQASPSEPSFTVAQALRLSPLDGSTVVAGNDGAADQVVRWVAVIERPVEDFVAPGELVLTTGLGCDDGQFEQLVREVAAAGAAGLCVGVGAGAPLARVPAGARRLGDRLGFPIVEVPWEVRFADILRVIVDRVLSTRYAAAAPAGQPMPSGLTTALLRRDGLDSIAHAAEQMLDRPVIVLGAAFAPLTAGPRAAARGDDVAALAERAAALTGDELVELRRQIDDDVVAMPGIPALGLPSTLVATAAAQGRALGYVLALGEGRQANVLTVERQALRHTAVAAAIELLRQHAAAEAEARVHGDFLWELAADGLGRQELAAKATLLGYSLHERFRVLIARAEDAAHDATLAELVQQVLRRGAAERVRIAHRPGYALILVPMTAPPLLAPERLAQQLSERLPPASVSWGIADGGVDLLDLADGVGRARRALELGRALRGPGTVADAGDHEPYLMLGGLIDDGESRRVAEALLEPLVRYDEGPSRELLWTLEIYLQENGNTSSAARRLYLNRHSLIYRLRKIEALTGRDLNDHEDRFLFEVSLRMHRMTVAQADDRLGPFGPRDGPGLDQVPPPGA